MNERALSFPDRCDQHAGGKPAAELEAKPASRDQNVIYEVGPG